MTFATVALHDALGAILAHTTAKLHKGRVLDADDLATLERAGITQVTCVRLAADELDENAAAAAIAHALAAPGLRLDREKSGRANLRAATDGLFVVDAAAITRANSVTESITIATIADATPVRAGKLVATVKIIPFGVAEAAVTAAAGVASGALHVAAWRPTRVGLVMTAFATTPAALLDRAEATIATRLARTHNAVGRVLRVAHDTAAVADALAALAAEHDVVLALGASAIMDRRDVIPAAIAQLDGSVTRFGMPTEPGNLALIGQLASVTVIGMPGCARTLARSGIDWILERVLAGVPIDPARIAELGVGGLLVADERRTTRTVAAVILAAGTASRMGENKLLAELDGIPLVRHAVTAALASPARPVVVVTGNDAERVCAALAGLDVHIVHNAEFATGMASSLRTGIAAVTDAAGAIVCLGDMPRVTADHIELLVGAYADAADDRAIIVPTCDGERGNPVVWGREHFSEIAALTGDVGARSLISAHADAVTWLAVDDPAILLDVDTPATLAKLR